MITPSGWYPDADDLRIERYWDGSVWTEFTRPSAMSPNSSPTSTIGFDGSVSGQVGSGRVEADGGLGELFDAVESSSIDAANSGRVVTQPSSWTTPIAEPLAQKDLGWSAPENLTPGRENNYSNSTFQTPPSGAPAWAAWDNNTSQNNAKSGDWWAAPEPLWQSDQSASRDESQRDGLGIYPNSADVLHRDTIMIEGDNPNLAVRGRGKRRVSRLGGVALAILALMVWMAEDDREKLANSTIGTQLPVTESKIDSSDELGNSPLLSTDVSDGSGASVDVPDNTISSVVGLTGDGKSSSGSTSSSRETSKPVKSTPGVLDPTLLAPDSYSAGVYGNSSVVLSFIDSENVEIPKVRYEVRVYSKAGVKIVNTKELNLVVDGVSKTKCRIEIRTLLDGRHSNPLSFGCNGSG